MISRSRPTPENYLNLSLAYLYKANIMEAISAAPPGAETINRTTPRPYNNIGAAYNEMKSSGFFVVRSDKSVTALNRGSGLPGTTLDWAIKHQAIKLVQSFYEHLIRNNIARHKERLKQFDLGLLSADTKTLFLLHQRRFRFSIFEKNPLPSIFNIAENNLRGKASV